MNVVGEGGNVHIMDVLSIGYNSPLKLNVVQPGV